MIEKHDALELPSKLLLDHFISTDQQPTYLERRTLSESEISLLKELFWFTTNLTADSNEIAYAMVDR